MSKYPHGNKKSRSTSSRSARSAHPGHQAAPLAHGQGPRVQSIPRGIKKADLQAPDLRAVPPPATWWRSPPGRGPWGPRGPSRGPPEGTRNYPRATRTNGGRDKALGDPWGPPRGPPGEGPPPNGWAAASRSQRDHPRPTRTNGGRATGLKVPRTPPPQCTPPAAQAGPGFRPRSLERRVHLGVVPRLVPRSNGVPSPVPRSVGEPHSEFANSQRSRINLRGAARMLAHAEAPWADRATAHASPMIHGSFLIHGSCIAEVRRRC